VIAKRLGMTEAEVARARRRLKRKIGKAESKKQK
jgi:hypothetical protein